MIPKKFHQHPQLIGDTREQKFSLLSLFRPEYEPTAVKARRTFQQGDYGIPLYSGVEPGSQRAIVWERKEIADLYACMGTERERFTDEIQRLQEYRFAAVMISGTWNDLFTYAAHRRDEAAKSGKRGVSDAAIVSTIRRLQVWDRIFIFFCGTEERIAREIEAQADCFWRKQIENAQNFMPKRGEEARP